MTLASQSIRPRTSPQSGGAALTVVLLTTAIATAVLWGSGEPPVRAAQALTLDDPAALVVGAIRLAGLALAVWLLSVTLLALLLRLLGAHLLSRAVTHLLPRAMRRLVQVSFGISLVGATFTGPAMAAGSATGSVPRPTVAVSGDLTNGQRWPVIPPAPTSSTPQRATASIPSTGRVSLPPTTIRAAATTTTAMRTTSTTHEQFVQFDVPVPITSAPTSAPASEADTWTVKPGDHFWSIAERVVKAQQPDATPHDISRYWLHLIATNRYSLDDPRNPDLLRIGVELTLPPL